MMVGFRSLVVAGIFPAVVVFQTCPARATSAEADSLALPLRKGDAQSGKKQSTATTKPIPKKSAASVKANRRSGTRESSRELKTQPKEKSATDDESFTVVALPTRKRNPLAMVEPGVGSVVGSHEKITLPSDDLAPAAEENTLASYAGPAVPMPTVKTESATLFGKAKDLLGGATHDSYRTFNTDYKTRGEGAIVPQALCGSGLNGKDLPIGGEDPYRKSLPWDYMPSDLVLIPTEYRYGGEAIYLRHEAAQALCRMFAAAARNGLRLQIFSGYRDTQHQARLYNEAVARSGSGQKGVAKPGHSEHMLGTTADITSNEHYLMNRAFLESSEGRWMAKNAASYGWKMTVAHGSGPRTHVDEPWHIRYLGSQVYSYKRPGEINNSSESYNPRAQKPSFGSKLKSFFGFGSN